MCGRSSGHGTVADVFLLLCAELLIGKKGGRSRITFYGYDPRLMLQVTRVGFSPFVIIALDNVLIISLNMVIQRLGGPGQGDTILTCAAIVQSFMLIITMPLGGITSGTQTILGLQLRSKKADRIWKAERWIVTCAPFVQYGHVSGSPVCSGDFCADLYPQRGICSLKRLGYPDVHAGRDPAGSTYTIVGRIYR